MNLMLYNIIALIFIGLSLGAIIFVVIRNLSRAKTIDVNTIQEEKEARVRERILVERMKRRWQSSQGLWKKASGSLGEKIHNWWTNLLKKAQELEKKYQRESAGKNEKFGGDKDQQIKALLVEAMAFYKKEEYSDAEKKYIEVISLDLANREAYSGLVDIYQAQKEYQQALQTALYILKLDKKESKAIIKKTESGEEYKSISNAEIINEDYLLIGEIYLAMSDQRQAFTYFQKALELTPNDPKTLDLLINCAIILSDKSKAFDYLKRLEEVNPGNQKLMEFKKRLEDL